MVFLIFLNCIVFAVDIELKSNEKDHYYALQVLEMIETLSLFVFIIEVGLKWIDNFRAYFSDGWEVFDFTLLSLVGIETFVKEIRSLRCN
jgi:cation channel sperm-associated protein 2